MSIAELIIQAVEDGDTEAIALMKEVIGKIRIVDMTDKQVDLVIRLRTFYQNL